MQIWGELLWLENAAAGFLTLSLTGKLLQREPWKAPGSVRSRRLARLRLLLGSCLSGIWGFTLFWQLSWWMEGLLQLAAAALLLLLVLPPQRNGVGTARSLLRQLLLFYLVNLLMGAVTLALMWATRMEGLRFAGGFYIGGWISYLYLLAGMGLTWLLTADLARLLQKRRLAGRTAALVQVEVEGRTAVWQGLLDTGNFLSDPGSGAPVFLAEEKSLQALLPQGIPAHRLCWIPYRAVGTQHGVLLGLRPDRVAVAAGEGEGFHPLPPVVIAAYKGQLPGGWEQERCQVLLHPAVWDNWEREGSKGGGQK